MPQPLLTFLLVLLTSDEEALQLDQLILTSVFSKATFKDSQYLQIWVIKSGDNTALLMVFIVSLEHTQFYLNKVI